MDLCGMKRLFASAAILTLASSAALAAEPSPIGDWRVKDGYANIRIDNCGGKIWGIVAWEREPGFDTDNPDPAKKGRPTLGLPILLGLKQTKPNYWEGEIYNSNNGKTYDANISMVDDNTLKLQGCVLGFLCGGENWTRVTTPPPNSPPLPPLPNAPKDGAKAPPTKGAAKGAPPPQSEVCTRVTAESAPQQPPQAAKGASK